MATEQMNISMPPQMARFIRSKVKAGAYSDVSEAILDAVRRMQDAEAKQGGREGIRRGVRQGIKDIEEGRYEEFDADGLRGLAKKLVAASAEKRAGRSKAK